jgi:serine/threonine protein kinase
MTGSIGTFLYMAPEILSNQRTYDESCDVYSFAVVMYELLFETAPFASEDTTSTGSVFQLGMSILQGRRPAIPIAVYNEQELGLIEIMKACWSQNPEDRPTFKNVFMELEKVKIN